MSEQTWSAESYLKDTAKATQWPFQAMDFVIASLVFFTLTTFAIGWYAPSFAKWLVIALFSSICWLRLGWDAKRGLLRVDPIDAVATVLFLWAALSIRWSADPMTGKDTVIHWAMLLGVFFFMRRRSSLGQTVSVGIAAAAGSVVVIVFEWLDFGVYGGFYNPNMETEMLLAAMPFLLPVAAVLSGTRWRWYILAIALGIASYLVLGNSSKIEFAVWSALGTFFSIAFFAKRSLRHAVVAGAIGILGVLFLIFLGWDSLSIAESKGFRASFLPRLEYTINTLSVWWTHPIKGVGAGGFNAVFPYHQDVHAALMGISSDAPKGNPLFETAGAAHNDILQFLANFGLIGLLIVIVGVYLARSDFYTWRQSPERTAGLTVLLSVLTNALLEFPLQMPSTLLLFTIGLAWLLPLNQRENDGKPFELVIEFRFAVALAAVVAVIVNAWWSWGFFPAQRAFANVLATIYVDAHKALEYNEEAINRFPYDDMFRRQYIITLMRWDETTKARVVTPEGYDKIFAVAATVGPVTGTLILRLQYLLQSNRFRELPDETRRWRNLLVSQSSRVPDVWLLEAVFEGQANNRKGLEDALARYFVLTSGGIPENRAALIASLRSDLAKLIEAEQKKPAVGN